MGAAKSQREKAKQAKKRRKRMAAAAAASEEAGDAGSAAEDTGEAERINSRKALHEKLERRIAELREERRKNSPRLIGQRQYRSVTRALRQGCLIPRK